jgi:hypothetical protein
VHLAQEIMAKTIHTQAMRYKVSVDLDRSIGRLNGNQPKSASLGFTAGETAVCTRLKPDRPLQ